MADMCKPGIADWNCGELRHHFFMRICEGSKQKTNEISSSANPGEQITLAMSQA